MRKITSWSAPVALDSWWMLPFFLSHLSQGYSVNCEVLIERHPSRFVAEVGAAGRLQAEMGTIRGDAWWLPNAHSQQIVDAAHLWHCDGPEARADLHRSQRQRWEWEINVLSEEWIEFNKLTSRQHGIATIPLGVAIIDEEAPVTGLFQSFFVRVLEFVE